MRKYIKDITVALKGYAMGAANIVPGISGGTIALLTGIYAELIAALNSLVSPTLWKKLFLGHFREFCEGCHGRFLLALFIGVGVSLVSLAKLMEYVIVWYPVQTWAFFFGLIIASAVYMFADIRGWKVVDVFFVAAGLALGVGICTMTPTQTPDAPWFIFICGAIAICTMILPGISGSFILVILSKYEYIIGAVNSLNLPVLAMFGLGCVVGILAFAKFLHWLLARYEKQTMLVLIGFVLGSLVKVWPWNDMGSVAKAYFLRSGMDPVGAQTAVETMLEKGANLMKEVDLSTTPAIIWALAGLALVWAIETLSHKKV